MSNLEKIRLHNIVPCGFSCYPNHKQVVDNKDCKYLTIISYEDMDAENLYVYNENYDTTLTTKEMRAITKAYSNVAYPEPWFCIYHRKVLKEKLTKTQNFPIKICGINE